MADKKERTTIEVPKHSEQAVNDIRKIYPEISLAKITKALMNLGASKLATDPEALKDALLRA